MWANQFTSKVKIHDLTSQAWGMWKLIPTEVDGGATPPDEEPGLGPAPPYNENERRGPTTQAEYERDDFGTVVTEVTIVTTRKKYRVEDT